MEKVENIDGLATVFDSKIDSLPSSYLDLPLGAPFKSMVAWDGVEKSYRWELWGRKTGIIFLGSEKGVWCRIVESDKDWDLVSSMISFLMGGGCLESLVKGGSGGGILTSLDLSMIRRQFHVFSNERHPEFVGASLIDYRDTFGLTWFSYRQKAQEAFKCKPFMHLLNDLEGEE
ncbi:hypothetical protein CK203_101811 [Vitis vinifera]|uniref:Uncharacterized protein n=1 Tax=Vitis vinifera TaxID=29760 RepID=A0A438ESX3_VITVI|nr:hypothetical protein CK203_101811 [Vitis vinifera]